MAVDIGVCTFRRPHLEQTLRSLGELEVPAGVSMRVIVADNDATPSARALVKRLASGLPFEIAYVHCPASNISLARNACLDNAKGEWLAFIDDDSTASSIWLAELLKTAEASGADVVLGPVRAVYTDAAPAWMKAGDFHSTRPVIVDGEIRTGYSGNALLRRSSPYLTGRRFNLALGRTGGEDTEFFALMRKAGGSIAYAPLAVADEPVPAERASFAWLAKRRFRSGQTHGRLLAQSSSVVANAGIAAVKAAWCFGAAFATVAVASQRNRHALRGALHLGAVSGLLGLREISLYGDKAVERQSHAA